jgi:hypothetical protein
MASMQPFFGPAVPAAGMHRGLECRANAFFQWLILVEGRVIWDFIIHLFVCARKTGENREFALRLRHRPHAFIKVSWRHFGFRHDGTGSAEGRP